MAQTGSGRDDALSSGKRDDDADGTMVALHTDESNPIDSNFFSDNLDRELEMLSERSIKSQGSTNYTISIDEDQELEAKQAMSLYLKQSTISSSNVTNQQDEASRIRNSFSGVHFSSVKTLPSLFKPGAVTESRRVNANNNINSLSDTAPRGKKPVTTNGMFSPLKYKSSEYKKEIADKRENERVKRINGLAFSRKPFTYTSSPLRLKNEDLFGDETYSFPAPDPGKGVIDIKDCVRTDFIDGSKFLHGPFAVSGKRSGEAEVSREEGIHWCTDIYNKIKEDWNHLRFSIKYSNSDEIIISFDLDMLKNSNGDIQDGPLCKYMTRLTTHGLAAKHRLKKRGDRWRVIEDVEVVTKATDGSDDNIVTSKEVLIFVYVAPWCRNISLKVKRNAAVNGRIQARDTVLKKNKLKKTRKHNSTGSLQIEV
mmetsp:Transcript_13250/g.21699  ORF Transcript_13250/g.21699 Transcript_13250/m.21699 type:complete len:425 (+) Transcript_13250:72-1346(+)